MYVSTLLAGVGQMSTALRRMKLLISAISFRTDVLSSWSSNDRKTSVFSVGAPYCDTCEILIFLKLLFKMC